MTNIDVKVVPATVRSNSPVVAVTTLSPSHTISAPQGLPGRDSIVPGPKGDKGDKGDPGIEGQPGGGIFRAIWNYHNSPNPPPADGEIRTSADSTEMYLAERDIDGFDRSTGLEPIQIGGRVLLKGTGGGVAEIVVSGPIVDMGTWRRYPVTVISGGPLDTKKGTDVELQFTHPLPQGPPGEDAQWTEMTQAAYTALPVKDPGTLYVVIG